MKMTMLTASTLPQQQQRVHRKVLRAATKRLQQHQTQQQQQQQQRNSIGKLYSAVRPIDPCENSNDSGLGGFDNHMDYPPPPTPHNKFTRSMAAAAAVVSDLYTLTPLTSPSKKCKTEMKMESEEDDCCCKETTTTTTTLIRTAPTSMIGGGLGRSQNHPQQPQRAVPRCLPLTNRRNPTGPITLTTQLGNVSRNGKVQLQIVCQPEQQHRARYQTEGSRGAVKDRTGNGFPIVKLIGYDKPAILQVFIGSDIGRITPHMFYQACRVSGKNSTPCVEKKIEGTIVIEVDLDPGKEMMVTCDCVGILKERNVDVEHRFPEQSGAGARSKKKSTRCRMVFRTTIQQDDGTNETLQTTSQPIVCTQPPGIPEICKKSLSMCPSTGNMELFILGKNFLKDTRVIFQQLKNDVVTGERDIIWEESVIPDKEYLQQTHLVCVVPAYFRHDILEPVSVSLFVFSSGKTSEAHQFMYTPSPTTTPRVTPNQPATFISAAATTSPRDVSTMLWQQFPGKSELDMMPPPIMPIIQRRPSTNLISSAEQSLKTEMMDDSSQSSEQYHNENSMDVHPSDSNMAGNLSDSSMDGTNSISILHHESTTIASPTEVIPELKGIDLRMKAVPSLATLRHFGVAETTQPLPAQSAQSVENYLTTIENKLTSAPSNFFVVDQPPPPDVVGSTPVVNAVVNPVVDTTNQILAQAQHTTLAVAQSAARLDALVATAMESTANILTETAATVKLDALVNSTVDTHMGSPTSTSPSPPQQPSLPAILDIVTTPPITGEPEELNQSPPVLVPTFNNIVLNGNFEQPSPVIPIPVKEMTEPDPPPIPAPNGVIKVQRLITNEITTMSDTDLLSYINPSCFDQDLKCRVDSATLYWGKN